jgi:hypothetical protein
MIYLNYYIDDREILRFSNKIKTDISFGEIKMYISP